MWALDGWEQNSCLELGREMFAEKLTAIEHDMIGRE